MTSTTCSKRETSNVPSGRRNFMRLIEARLQAESSTCMYSEHGFDALMRPELGDVCHWLMVVSYWTPGSAQRHAASAMSRMSSRALTVSTTAEYRHELDAAEEATGLDESEWGVTLLSHNTQDIKEIVYEMRFDEVSSLYGEFGDFYIGLQLPLDELFRRVGI